METIEILFDKGLPFVKLYLIAEVVVTLLVFGAFFILFYKLWKEF